MPHVCIQRFRARDAQHNRAQDNERDARIVPNKQQGVMGAEGFQNHRIAHDVKNTQARQRGKPDEGDGAKKAPDAGRTPLLHHK